MPVISKPVASARELTNSSLQLALRIGIETARPASWWSEPACGCGQTLTNGTSVVGDCRLLTRITKSSDLVPTSKGWVKLISSKAVR